MYKRIMAPNDDSPNAKNALMRAARLAKHYDAELRIVRVCAPMMVIEPLPVAADLEMQQKAIDDQLAVDLRELEALARKCRHLGVRSVLTVLLQGSPGPELRDHAERARVDLIVMASHSRGDIARVALGSVTDFLIRSTNIPVFVIKGQRAISQGDETVFKRILVPLDGSDLAEKILPHVAAFASPQFTTVNFLQVLTPQTYSQKQIMDPVLPWWESEFSAADDYLEHTAANLRRQRIRVVSDVILNVDVTAGILAHAEEHRSDLIALSTSGAGGIKRLVFGSIADQVLRKSPISVIVVHPGQSGAMEYQPTSSVERKAWAIG